MLMKQAGKSPQISQHGSWGCCAESVERGCLLTLSPGFASDVAVTCHQEIYSLLIPGALGIGRLFPSPAHVAASTSALQALSNAIRAIFAHSF